MSYSKAICRAITDFLKADDWHYELDEDREVIKASLSLNNKMKSTLLTFDLRDDKYILYCSIPLNVDPGERAEMRKLINRINDGIMFGCLEMDDSDGEVRMRYPVDCDNCLPSQEIIKNSIYRSAYTLKKYGNALVQVIMGVATAEEAYQSAQKKDN